MTPLPEPAQAPSSPGICDTFGPLLRLDDRDKAGLRWIKQRARFWLTALKRRRKYLPRGASFTPEESILIGHLTALENAAGRLLGIVDTSNQTEKNHNDTFNASTSK